MAELKKNLKQHQKSSEPKSQSIITNNAIQDQTQMQDSKLEEGSFKLYQEREAQRQKDLKEGKIPPRSQNLPNMGFSEGKVYLDDRVRSKGKESSNDPFHQINPPQETESVK